jgi:hypothetical protein
LTGGIPKSEVDGSPIDHDLFSTKTEPTGTNHHQPQNPTNQALMTPGTDLGRVVVEDGRNVFSRESVGGI